MIATTGERRISIDLGDGVYVDVDVNDFALSGPVVPKPKPKTIAELVVDVSDPSTDGVTPVKIGFKVAVVHRR
ncbi:hypothetical protein [Pseudoxanthomonas sp. J35]|uniref:hypothetical protein n=1 Tax=Pseudoxanthomonas sp. J35 TaxID=935852 RepID=UPI00048F9573|nr:hypothetical protein [Pseudoxanthomonas sp. J35]